MIEDYLTRGELSLGRLELNQGNFRIDGADLDPGATTWQRTTADSPWVHGDVEIHRVKSAAVIEVGLYISGVSVAELNQYKTVLAQAVEQTRFQYHRIRDGIETAWLCRSADYSIGSPYLLERQLVCRAKLIIPRNPVPLVGVV